MEIEVVRKNCKTCLHEGEREFEPNFLVLRGNFYTIEGVCLWEYGNRNVEFEGKINASG